MSGETRLWLIRHAPVAGPRGLIHNSDAPADFADGEAIRALRGQLPSGVVVYASPSRRTMETARVLGLDPREEPLFREQNFGSWTGRRHDDLAREFGEDYRQFWRHAATNRPPDGESFADQVARVRAGVENLLPGDVVMVVHSGTIRAMLAIALDAAPESALRFVIDPLSLTRIDRLEQGWRLVCVNRR